MQDNGTQPRYIAPGLRQCHPLLRVYGISETLLHRLQVVQNSAARLIMTVRKREHITPIMFALHWLPVRQRIQYKILKLVYRCLNQQAPAYLSTCITPYVPGRFLRSSDHGLLTEHRYRLERYGRRCFTVAGPALWNELPTPVKECQSFPSCVVLVTFEHFKLFYLVCFYNYFTIHFNK